MTTTPRRQKTPRERAEEAVGVAERRVKRLRQERNGRRAQLVGIEADLAEAEARLDYAKKDPALPPTAPSTPTGKTSNQSGDTTE